MLHTTGLKYSYDHKQELSFPDITCEQGSHWLILGQSGCGKTTLLHLLGGLLTPAEGEIEVAGTRLRQLRSIALDRFRGRHIGIIFQKPHFVRSLTVGENLQLARYLAGLAPDPAQVGHLLERLNIGHKTDARPDRLSEGERQRVAIALALVNRPKVILADEPTSALDDHNTQEVIRLLEEQATQAEATLLVVTHDNRLQAHFPHQIHLHPIANVSGSL